MADEHAKRSGDNARWQWISVVDVGTFLIVPVMFWMMWRLDRAFTKNFDVIDNNTEAIPASTAQAHDV